ncbi:MAG: hypothetical protein V4654_02300 [Bdellovibrionota bacterium]
MKLSLFVTTLLISASAFSAILCPVTSCNPHNGCMDGCSNYRVFDSADCTPDDPKVGETVAINAASKHASGICRSGYFLRTKWNVRSETTNDKCTVKAEAYVSCYQ